MTSLKTAGVVGAGVVLAASGGYGISTLFSDGEPD
ncbi:hypothetical protein MHSWG343_05580 [Candidatus Mycoplasma haematohominis]|uniref:Uncharacterized protein n=1 Tax=Candidatus Mycoplasma haematohominis TaxID=1494318 RepID=A0A478FQ34_9MOLU|nr:hypothetical protein MHSWG343_05580 [Candidatus Mycoplasma haemohominis]